MTAQIPFAPYASINGAGSFNVSSVGFIQGQAMPDPSARFWLTGGILANSETLPMWGGVGISENIPGVAGQPAGVLGGQVVRATTLVTTANGGLTGFSVFDQNHAAVSSPSSPVPLVASYGQVNFYRLGSKARIPLAIDPALASLEGSIIGQRVSWDFLNQRLIPYTAGYNNVTITGAVWANTAGGQITYTVSTDLTAVLSAGSDINVSGVVSTGGTGLGYNGSFTVVSVTSTTIVVTFAAASTPGTYSSGGLVLADGGAVNLEVIDIQVGNSMTVSYNTVTGAATWNRSGACALVYLN